jgi:hypothetical protein
MTALCHACAIHRTTCRTMNGNQRASRQARERGAGANKQRRECSAYLGVKDVYGNYATVGISMHNTIYPDEQQRPAGCGQHSFLSQSSCLVRRRRRTRVGCFPYVAPATPRQRDNTKGRHTGQSIAQQCSFVLLKQANRESDWVW